MEKNDTEYIAALDQNPQQKKHGDARRWRAKHALHIRYFDNPIIRFVKTFDTLFNAIIWGTSSVTNFF